MQLQQKHPYHYNCAGFAFDNPEWLSPFATAREGREWLRRNHKKVRKCARLMQKFCADKGARLVGSPRDVLNDEYAVAFRAGERDFHFVRFCENMGQWVEKRGNRDELENYGKNLPHAPWHEVYDGAIIYMAVKKGFEWQENEDYISHTINVNDGWLF